MAANSPEARRLNDIERAFRDRAHELGLFLVYDRPDRVDERPALARTYFAERCESDEQLENMLSVFRNLGVYVELFEGEQALVKALGSGRLHELGRPWLVVYNGIGWGIGKDAFKSGRKALVPLLADSYGIICPNASPYACVITRHKFHCFRLLEDLGVDVPATWHYRPTDGWIGGAPPMGTKIIVKSTFEAWAVGVTADSVFIADDRRDERVAAIAEDIGQAVTVQEFVSGPEVYVPVLSCPAPIIPHPLEVIIDRAPGDPEAVMTIEDNLKNEAVDYRRFDASPEILDRLRTRALQIVDVLELDGLTRIDFRVDHEGNPRVFDIAASPGLEPGGASASSFMQLGFDHSRFLRLVVAAALVNADALTV